MKKLGYIFISLFFTTTTFASCPDLQKTYTDSSIVKANEFAKYSTYRLEKNSLQGEYQDHFPNYLLAC
jgi:hypothetical protein